jgi:3-hydroxybutyryl-CoA dehydratase
MTTVVEAGQALPDLRKAVTQEQINRYAEASGDFNPIHLDAEFATASSFGRIVAHGMLVLAFLSEMMTTAFGSAWLESGNLKVRFRAPAYPGDKVTIFGQVTKVVDLERGRQAVCAVGCRNQKGEDLITGEASVAMEAQTG